MAVDALVGFVGVALGAASTSILTIYKERFTARREREAWNEQQRREREEQRNIFQRESVLALQSAVSDLVKSVYDEQDRMLVEMEQAKRWPVRQWETTTAAGWADAEMRLEMLRVRIFDEEISSLAGRVRTASKESVWATNVDDAKQSNQILEQLFIEFNDRVGKVLPKLYEVKSMVRYTSRGPQASRLDTLRIMTKPKTSRAWLL
ncbi:MAG: hypothetical protein LC776_09870 [Acidobacteria bacterium]|nr:hypothetical protein [Acidobacteriota bacterium]